MKLTLTLTFLLPCFLCQESSRPFKEPIYQKIRTDDDLDSFLPAMYSNFYEEKRSLVFDRTDDIITNKGPIVKTLYSSSLNLLKTEDDKQVLVYDYTYGKVSGYNKAWKSCFAEPVDKHNLRTQL